MFIKKQKKKDDKEEIPVFTSLSKEALGHLNVAILESDIHAAQLMRHTLASLNVTQVHLTKNSDEIFDILENKPVDVLFTEWNTKPKTGLDIVTELRARPMPMCMLPVVMVTSRTSEPEHTQALNAGVNEIMAKPFNIRKVTDSVLAVVDKPKPFIICDTYTGPERRDDKGLDSGETERRDGDSPIVIFQDEIGDESLKGKACMILPDFSLRFKLEALASPKALKAGKNILERTVNRVVEDNTDAMMEQVRALKDACKALEDNLEAAYEEQKDTIINRALFLRALAIRSNYIFVARLSITLHEFCKQKFLMDQPNHVMIINQHVTALHAIIAAKMVGDDNKMGRELVNELRTLTLKNT